jgi:hypothetical protein
MTTFHHLNGRRAAVYRAQHPASAEPEPVGAGISRPERDPCGYGVPRALCHIGCGYNCRRAKDGHLIR